LPDIWVGHDSQNVAQLKSFLFHKSLVNFEDEKSPVEPFL